MTVRPRGVLAALFLLAFASAPLTAQRVAFIDSRRILAEMPGRAQVETKLRLDLEGLSAREKKMVDSLNGMLATFAKDSATMMTEERTKRFAVVQALDAQYRDTLQALQTEAQTKQGEAMQPLFDIIRLALEDVRQADGYAMIFDLGSQSNPIVAMDKNLDISDKVLVRIRAMPATRPGTPAAAPAAAPKPPAGPVQQPAGVTRKP